MSLDLESMLTNCSLSLLAADDMSLCCLRGGNTEKEFQPKGALLREFLREDQPRTQKVSRKSLHDRKKRRKEEKEIVKKREKIGLAKIVSNNPLEVLLDQEKSAHKARTLLLVHFAFSRWT